MSEYPTDQILDMIEALGDPSKLDLSEARLGRRADLSGIDLSEETIQRKYKERGWPKDGKDPPWYSTTAQGIDLRGANFHGANLRGANLKSCNLQDANLPSCDLREANLSETKLQRVEFSNAQLQGARLRGARVDRTQFRDFNVRTVGEEQHEHYGEAREVYRDLKANFKSLAYYNDARWAYLKERAMDRKSHPWYSPFWFISWIENIFTGYMERVWVIILWLAIWPLLFDFLYWQVGGVTNLLGNPPPPVSPLDYLFFSLRTMVTLAYSDFTPVGAGQWVAPLEGALGIIFLALLGFSVAKRIARD